MGLGHRHPAHVGAATASLPSQPLIFSIHLAFMYTAQVWTRESAGPAVLSASGSVCMWLWLPVILAKALLWA